jgi:hypothetical protein
MKISTPPIFLPIMSMFRKRLISACAFLMVVGGLSINAAAPGSLEGHLKIISLKEVELADGTLPTKPTAENYSEYPLIIFRKEGKKEIARVTADGHGNYHVALPPGDYILDVPRNTRGLPLGHLRANPQLFTVAPGQAVRVDMSIDTGVR